MGETFLLVLFPSFPQRCSTSKGLGSDQKGATAGLNTPCVNASFPGPGQTRCQLAIAGHRSRGLVPGREV